MSEKSSTALTTRWRSLLISILFGINIALLIGVSIASLASRQELVSVRKERNALLTIERSFAGFKQTILATDSSLRGALLTSDSRYLERLEKLSAESGSLPPELEEALSGYPNLKTEWDSLQSSFRDRQKRSREEVMEELVPGEDFRVEDQKRFEFIENELSGLLLDVEDRFLSGVNRVTLILNVAAFLAVGTGVVGVAMLLGVLQEQGRMRDLEDEKNEAERSDREKSKFLASMNHEIRTPLNAMLGFSELLSREINSDRGKRYLRAINESGESLSDLINDILDLSKIESGMLELDESPVRIQDFARSMEMLFLGESESSGIGLITEVETAPVEVVQVDGLRLRQILVNLLGNAFKFTHEGNVTLRFRTTDESSDGRCDLIVEVEDTGRGISREKLDLIFKPFQQAEANDEMKGGTGLGLSISRELAQLMGGSLEAESREGEGALFRLRLHKVETGGEAPESLAGIPGEFDLAAFSPMRILVVDDNRYNRELIAGFFEDSPHELAFANDGEKALKVLETGDFDLVFMDIRMPNMGGEEARRLMLENVDTRKIPVIAITASSLMRREERLRELFDGYLRKPFTGAGLFAVMKKVCPQTPVEEVTSASPETPETGTPETKINPERKAELVALYESKGRELTEAMVFSEIRQWSRELQAFAEEHRLAVLSEYAERLDQLVDAFDQSGLERELSRFDELLDRL